MWIKIFLQLHLFVFQYVEIYVWNNKTVNVLTKDYNAKLSRKFVDDAQLPSEYNVCYYIFIFYFYNFKNDCVINLFFIGIMWTCW